MNLTLYKSPKLIDILHVCRHLQEDEREQYSAFTGRPYDFEDMAVEFANRAPSWVLCADEIPIVVAGFDLVRPGVWQDWMLTKSEAWDPKVWRTTTKHVRSCMNAMLNSEAHRLQCVSLASRIHAHRWYRVLGMKLEGTLKAYGANGEDAMMFARVKD